MRSAQRPRSAQLSSTGMRALTGASHVTGSAPTAQGLPRTSAIPALERLFFSVSYTTPQGRLCQLSPHEPTGCDVGAPWLLTSSCCLFFLYISFTFFKPTENRQDGMVQGTHCPLPTSPTANLHLPHPHALANPQSTFTSKH